MSNTLVKHGNPLLKSNAHAGSWRQLFFATLAQVGTVRKACDAIGISSQEVRQARRVDPAFDQLLTDYIEDFTERLEDVLYQKALAGHTVELIFALKGLNGPKYKERGTNVVVNDNSRKIISAKTYIGFSPDDWEQQENKDVVLIDQNESSHTV